MNAIALAVMGLGAFGLGYVFYSRFIATRLFQLCVQVDFHFFQIRLAGEIGHLQRISFHIEQLHCRSVMIRVHQTLRRRIARRGLGDH